MNPEVDLEGGHTFRPPSLTGERVKNGMIHTVDEGRSKDNKEFVALMNAVTEKHRDQGEVCVEKRREEFESIACDEGMLCWVRLDYCKLCCPCSVVFSCVVFVSLLFASSVVQFVVVGVVLCFVVVVLSLCSFSMMCRVVLPYIVFMLLCFTVLFIAVLFYLMLCSFSFVVLLLCVVVVVALCCWRLYCCFCCCCCCCVAVLCIFVLVCHVLVPHCVCVLVVLLSFLVQSFFETLQYCDEWRKFTSVSQSISQ